MAYALLAGKEVNGGGDAMRSRKQVNTTLGDLIAAVSDEVKPLARSRADANVLVSYILNDLIASRRVRLRKSSVSELS